MIWPAGAIGCAALLIIFCLASFTIWAALQITEAGGRRG